MGEWAEHFQYSEETDILVSKQPQRRYHFIQVESHGSLQFYEAIRTDFVSESWAALLRFRGFFPLPFLCNMLLFWETTVYSMI